MSERILITGGAGFIGSHTADALLEAGYDVRVLDLLVPPVHPTREIPEYLDHRIEVVVGDVRSPEVLRSALAGVDRVLHLAAYQDYRRDFSTYFDVNVSGTALLFETIIGEHLPIRKVVVAASQFVQGEGAYRTVDRDVIYPSFRPVEQLELGIWDHVDEIGRPLTPLETPADTTGPTNAYGLSKRSQEELSLLFGRRYEIPTTVLRYSIVQGSRQSVHNTYSGICRIFVLGAIAGTEQVIYEDGEQLRDFVNIDDVVSANLLALFDERTDHQRFNVSGPRAVTINEFAEVTRRVVGQERLLTTRPGLFRFGDARHCLSDNRPLRSLGWEPSVEVEESIRQYFEWVQDSRRSVGIDPKRAILEMQSSGVVRSVTDQQGVTARASSSVDSTSPCDDPADPLFWEQAWKEGRTGFDRPEPHPFLVEHFGSVADGSGNRVLVPLCGATVDMIELADRGYLPIGVEVSRAAVELFFERCGLGPSEESIDGGILFAAGPYRILLADFFRITPDEIGPIDLLYDRAALIAMPEQTRGRYIEQTLRLCGGAVPGLLICIERESESGPPFSVARDEVDRLCDRSWHISELGRRRGGRRRGERVETVAYRLEPKGE